MKKILTMIVTLGLLLSLTACSCGSCKSTPLTPEASYFLTNYKESGVVENLKEVATYSVTFTNNGKQASNGIKATCTSGTYITDFSSVKISDAGTLENAEYNAEDYCYKFFTNLTFNGTYEYKSQTKSFADEITATVWFLGEKDNFKPIKMQKVVKCTTPYANYKTNGEVSIEFLDFDFDFCIDYSTNNAIIDYTDTSADQNFGKQDTTINNYFSNTFFESELMLLYPRAFKLNSSFSTNRQTITVDGKTSLNMKVAGYNDSYSGVDMGTENEKPLKINGKNLTVKIDVVQFNNTGNYQGQPTSIYFTSVDDTNGLFRIPVRMENYMTLVGPVEYNLTQFYHLEG